MKKIISLAVVAIMILTLSLSVFATDCTGSFTIRAVADATSVKEGDTLSVSIYVDADDSKFTPTNEDFGSSMVFDLKVDTSVFTYNKNASEKISGITLTQKTNGVNIEGTFTQEINLTDPIAIIVFTVGAVEAKAYSFEIANTSFMDLDTCDEAIIDVVNASVAAGSTEPEYPYVENDEVFTDGTYAGITTTADTKAIAVFGKAPEGGLEAGAYGAKVVMGGKTFKFAGLADVEAGKVWAVKIVSPDGTFAFSDGTTLADYEISAY